jgi:hypothetical protein
MLDMPTTCTFCGKPSTEVGPMVEGLNDVHICGPRLRKAKEIAGPKVSVMGKCGFCGRKLTSEMHYVTSAGDDLMCFECTARPLP